MTFTKLFILFAGSLITLSASAQSADSRAQMFNRYFLKSLAPSDYLNTEIRSVVPGTRKLLTVLPGVLYRGGGPGGTRPLPMESLKSLCEAGFSLAVYAYTEGFTNPGPVSCTSKVTGHPNTIEYIAGDANEAGFKQVFLRRVKNVAMDASRGPVFVHCWNGYHASGELAAVALRQFCGWDGDRASAYWKRHSGGFPLISRIAKFSPYGDLNVPSNVENAICE